MIRWLHIFSSDEEEVPAGKREARERLVKGSCDKARADHLRAAG